MQKQIALNLKGHSTIEHEVNITSSNIPLPFAWGQNLVILKNKNNKI